MDMKNKINIFSLVFHFLFVTVFALSPLVMPVAFAANTVMGVTPYSGTYTVGTPVNVDLVINGHGDTFNAAQATVALSNNLNLTGLTLGDCNFSYVKTPSVSNPAFVGVMLGSSSQKCTVYTLNILPLSTGTGTITLSNAAVKKYKTAQDALASLQNGSFTINPASNGTTSVSVSPTIVVIEPNPSSSYSLTVKAVNADNTPLAGVTVTLDGRQVEPGNNTDSAPALQTATADKDGIARFPDIPQGIHTVVVQHDSKQLAKTIFNVDGANHAMTLGIKSQEQPLDLTIIILGTILVLGIIFFLIKIFKGRKKTDK